MAVEAPSGKGTAKRTAFRLWPVHVHAGRQSSITALALGSSGDRLILGLSNGMLEDYRAGVAQDGSGIRLALKSRATLSSKAVKHLAMLEATQQLAAMVDGLVVLVHLGNLESRPVPGIKAISAMAVQPASAAAAQPACIAVAYKFSRKEARVSVLLLAASERGALAYGAATSEQAQVSVPTKHTVQAMEYVGQTRLIVSTALEYLLLDTSTTSCTKLFSLPEVATPPAFIQRLPGSRARAILMMDEVGLVVNSGGQPCQSALTLTERPLALAAYGLFVVSAGREELSVFQWATTECIQQIRYGAPDFPALGEKLIAVGGPPGAGIALAGRTQVWLLRPVTVKEQTKALLRSGEARAAIDLAAAASAPWASIVAAEACFILIHGCRFRDAFAAAKLCSPSQLQPREFFTLEPDHTAPWPTRSPAQQRWGVAPPLGPVFAIVDHVALPVGLQPGPLLALARRSLADYLLWAREQPGVEDADGVDTLIFHLLTDLHASEEAVQFARLPGCRADVKQLRRRLTDAGEDAALAHLAATCGHTKEALQLWRGIQQQSTSTNGNSNSGDEEAAALAAQNAAALMAAPEAADDEITLMFLPWLIGAAPAEALSVLKSRPLPQKPVLRLLTPGPLDPDLGWGDDPSDTLQLPHRRTSTVDGNLDGSADLRWQYLEHLVKDCGSADVELHAELAEALIDVIMPLLPPYEPSTGSASPHAMSPSRASDRLSCLREHLQSHLAASALLATQPLLDRLKGTTLWQEQVLLHSRAGYHHEALRLLVLEVGDLAAAERYAQQHLGESEGYRVLQHLLLHPGAGMSPMLLPACRLLHSAGNTQPPQEILESIPGDAPLAAVHQIVMALLLERTHRGRQSAVLRSLRRADSLAAAVNRAQMVSRRIVMTADENRLCQRCHSRVNPRLFAVQPNGALLCFRCHSNSSSDPGLSASLQTSQSAASWPD